MADLTEVLGQIDRDEQAVATPIKQRNGTPYLAADGSPSTLSVLGSESARYRERRQEVIRGAAENPDALTEAAQRIEIALGGVVAWSGWEAQGQPVPFTKDKARAMLALDHILFQVERAIHGRADFRQRLDRLIRHVRFEVALDQPADGKSGTTVRQLQRERLRRKLSGAWRALRNPHRFPSELGYLVRWAGSLHGRSGSGDGGVNPLSPLVLEAWARTTGVVLTPRESDALYRIDAALYPAVPRG